MATKTWQGTTDNWATPANWGGAIPVDGDVIVFPASNSQSVLTNVDRSSEDLNLNRIIVKEGYGGNIGTAANPLRCSVGSGSDPAIKHLGSKPFFYNAEIDTPSTGTASIYVDSRNKDNAFTLAGDDVVDRLMVARGKVTVSGSAGLSIGQLVQTYVTSPLNDSKVIIEANTTMPTTFYIYGGTMESNATTHVTVVLGGQAKFIQHAGNLSNCFIGPDAVLDLRAATSAITEIQLMGKMTFENNPNSVTITSLFRYPGGEIDYQEELVTITNDYNPFGE